MGVGTLFQTNIAGQFLGPDFPFHSTSLFIKRLKSSMTKMISKRVELFRRFCQKNIVKKKRIMLYDLNREDKHSLFDVNASLQKFDLRLDLE